MKKMQVLIVEDEPVILRSVKRGVEQLSDLFYVSDVAYDGVEALELIEQNQYDVIISDIVMPQMDGLSMLAEARKRGCNARFILLSGYDRFEYAQTAIDLRVVKYLLKPVDFEELKKCLMSIVDKSESTEVIKKSKKLWEKLKEYLDEHYAEDISCKDLAVQFGYSEKYITTIFKEKNGCTPSRYMVEKRMQKAKELLIKNQDELLLKEIAGKVGYTDPLYFSKVFKNCTGCSPSSYIKQHRNGEESCN